MKKSWGEQIAANRYLWAALGGLALSAAFPKPGIAGLAWIAPGWILFSALGRKGGEVFRIGYAGGCAYALAAFSWLLFIPFPAGAITGWLALSAYLGLYTASWVWLCWRLFPQPKTDIPPASADPIPGPGLSQRAAVRTFFRTPLLPRMGWALGCAVIWVALEMVLARLFTGFPWNLLGVSQYQILPVSQLASITGVYGVSFLLVWFSVALASATLRLLSNPSQPKSWVGDLILPLAVGVAVAAWGARQLARQTPPQRSFQAVLIQPSIPQSLIWDTNQNSARFSELITLSERALRETTNAQLLVWPEASVPSMLLYEREIYNAVTNLAGRHQVWMVLGSDDATLRAGSVKREYDFYNSSFLVSPRGEIASVYNKRRLVIFGEYIPLERWMPLMKYLTPVGGSFTAGQSAVPFSLPGAQAKISVLICFEDIFPHYAREYVETDTDFLLNLTNNGWFGESAAQWQHAANAVFRAIENRIPLVRCANNGLTCWIDSHGGVHDLFRDASGRVYGSGYQAVEVPLLGPTERRSATIYNRHGDWLGWGCVIVTILPVTGLAVRQVRHRIGKRFARS